MSRPWRPTLSLAAGYAGPPLTERAAFGPAGRRRSLEKLPPPDATLMAILLRTRALAAALRELAYS